MSEWGILNRQNLLNTTKVVCRWSLKGHFGQWIDIRWIHRSKINQGIIQEFNLGVSSHVSITFWCNRNSWRVFWGRWVSGGGGTPTPHCAIYYFQILLIWSAFFCWQLIIIFVYLTPALMFFFRTLANAFPTSYHIKSVCSCWVLKPSNNVCLLNLVPSVSFLTQSDSLEKKADQLLYIRKRTPGNKVNTHKDHGKTLKLVSVIFSKFIIHLI